MKQYLAMVGLVTIVVVGVWVDTRLTREDATTTGSQAAPERKERSAISVPEDPITTGGTAAPGRNERGAISAANFLEGQESGLARYQEAREDLVVVAGRLRQVTNLDTTPDTAWITINNIEGLEDYELLTASLKNPAAGTDALLEQIGRHGPITLEGRARNTPERISVLHITAVPLGPYENGPGTPCAGMMGLVKPTENTGGTKPVAHNDTVFAQVLKLVPRHEFESLARKHKSGRMSRSMTRWGQFVAMGMAQLTGRCSLRDIVSNLAAQSCKLYHLGVGVVTRSSLARVNAEKPWEMYEELHGRLLGRCPSEGAGTWLPVQSQVVLCGFDNH